MGNALRLGISRIGLAWTKRRMKTKMKRKSISILILGIQASGKTTIALRLWKYKRTLPDLKYVQTKGFNTFSIQRNNKSTINLYDLGGHSSIQELWDHYYADAHGVIFVVDVSDQVTLHDAGVIFAKVLNDDRIKGKPVLLLANKQDLGGPSEEELDSAMNLQEVVNSARCLTRLDASTATDLKNDKGIFDGFRWLVSHIENHYLELNDRVMHDTLEEKNREKARRAAVKEEMSQRSTPTKTVVDRPPSQKSLRSLKYIRKESSIELKHPLENPELSKGKETTNETITTTTTTNYLIKSRPNSSTGEFTANNPFLVERTVSTAPAGSGSMGNRRSLPAIFSSCKTRVSFFNATKQPEDSHVLVKNSSRRDSENMEQTSMPASGATTGCRLSPEGADSDEGITNPAFDDTSEKPIPLLNAENILQAALSNPQQDQMRKLIRTESSDTERAGEIMMVTTLVQVHQDQISKDRRGSTTSTHDSLALSISSFKSEDTECWKEDEETPPPPTPSQSFIPVASNASGLTSGVFLNSSTNTTTSTNKVTTECSSNRLPSLEKEKAKRKYSLKPGRNKTAPFSPGMAISTVQSTRESLNGIGIGNSRRFSGSGGANAPLSKKGRDSNPNSAKSKLKKKSLSGFSDPLEEASPGSQFGREATLNQIERLKKY